jgi:glycosyltransferase involved in cell wall biosynthesis
MKLLFIAPSAYLLGGVQDWLYATVVGLRIKGHEVEVGVPQGFFHNGQRFNSHFKGVNASFFRNTTGTNEGRVKSLKRFLEVKHPDIIVGVNIGNLFEAIARLRDFQHAKFAMTLHAIEGNYFNDMKEYKSVIDGVITTNRLSEIMTQSLGEIDQSRVFYAPYGIDQKQHRFKESLEPGITRIAWVGRLDKKQKRVDDLKQIVSHLDKAGIRYQLSIAGDGPARDEILQDLSEGLSNGNVRFYGMINKEELSVFYSANDILLITSEWETGPIVAWEAINAGLTIVSSRYIGSKAEKTLIDNETALLFDVGDAEGAAKNIVTLSDKKIGSRLQANAQQIVNLKYSSEASLNAWESAFEQIMTAEKQVNAETKNQMINKNHTGRLERYIGTERSEIIRAILPQRLAKDAGSEWPHSLQGINDQSWVLEYAREIEQSL